MTCADCSNNSGQAGQAGQAGLLLAINGADERLQVVIGRIGSTDLSGEPGAGAFGVEHLATQEWTVPGQAMRFLAPGIRGMLDGLGATAADVRRIACVHGPGSFTGLRMSLALAEGLAAGGGAKLAGLGHLELLAREAAQTAPGAVLALAWSRRGQVYAQAFQGQNALTRPEVIFLDALPTYLSRLPRPLAVLGGGLRRNMAAFEPLAEADGGLLLLPHPWDAPRPQTLLELAAEVEYSDGPLAPVYLRASDAEDNIAAIAAGRGLSESEAQAILARGSLTLR